MITARSILKYVKHLRQVRRWAIRHNDEQLLQIVSRKTIRFWKRAFWEEFRNSGS